MRPPSVGIVVPTKNRPEALARCVRSLAELDYPRDRFEVVVVDDGGSAPVLPGIEAPARGIALRVVETTGRGPAAARNLGAAAVGGSLLAFTDDDCVVEPGWLRALTEAHDESPQALVGGRIENGLPGNPFSAASHDLVEFLYEEYHPGAPEFFCSNNMAVPRDRFLALGGFDESFPEAAGEDRDLCDRWRLAGGTLRYAPEAVVRHDLDLGPLSFWSQHARYGRAAARFWRMQRARHGRSPRPEPPGFYLRMIGRPITRSSVARGLPRSALLVVAQLANAWGFFRARRRLPG